MANAKFNPARAGFLAGEIDWDTATIRAALVRGYTFNADHKFVSQVTGAGGVLHAVSAPLASKTTTAGAADAADVVWTAPASNASPHSVLIYQSSAVTGGDDVSPAEQRLICWFDTGTNVPITLNGGDVGFQWDNGANKIFRI